MFDRYNILKRGMLFTLALTAVLFTCSGAMAADTEESYPSYAGQEKILQLQTADITYRTTTAASKDHALTESGMKAASYRFENSVTYYYDGEETEVLSWTDKTYLRAGEVVVTLQSTVDEVALAQYELQLKRDTESYASQCTLYEKQIENKEQTVKTLSDIDKQIGELELQKLKLTYQQYQSTKKASIDDLQDRITQMKQNRESSVIVAEKDGYLYIPNSKLCDLENRPTVQKNEALFAIVSPGGGVFALSDSMRLGAVDDSGDAKVVNNSALCAEYGISVVGATVYDCDAVTESVLQSICGIDPADKWSPKFSFEIPVLADAVALKTSLIYDDNGNMLYSLLSFEGSYDYTARYYVNLLKDGMEQRQYVLLGPIIEESVVILDGVHDGDLVIM